MTATQKYLVKVAGVGVYGFLVYLQAQQIANGLSWDDLLGAVIAGGIGALGFAGLAKTPLENPGDI